MTRPDYWQTFITVHGVPFMPDTVREAPDACWIWSGDTDPHGIPRYRPGPGHPYPAARYIANELIMALPSGPHCCPADIRCVNPGHVEPVELADLPTPLGDTPEPCGHVLAVTGHGVHATPAGRFVRYCLACQRVDSDREVAFGRALLGVGIDPRTYATGFNRRTENPPDLVI